MRYRKAAKKAAAAPARRASSHQGAFVISDSDSLSAGDHTNRQWKFKVVFVGNSGVGKTWLVERVLMRQRAIGSHHYNSRMQAIEGVSESGGTIGVTVNLSKLRMPDGRIMLLQLWDTSGQDRYCNLVRSYMPGAQCVVIVYDPAEGLLASRQTLARWYAFAKEASASSETALDSLFAIVAISKQGRGVCTGDGGDDHLAAGVNFGRVFASSLCGCFFHQRLTLVISSGGSNLRRWDSQVVLDGLTPRWLAEQLAGRLRAKAEAAAGFLAAGHRVQQRLLPQKNGGVAKDKAEDTNKEGDNDSVGCFWCQRLLCSRALKCGAGTG